MNKKNFKKAIVLFLICSILLNVVLQLSFITNKKRYNEDRFIKNSATQISHISLLKNTNFVSTDHWYKERGALGDNKT
ncbi:MAG: hypothetical protein GF311_15540, partial [Candidatus Lokiarchaeota archaeon]|nr:hypothetical protein [Candidatus Lokiarchaeota archaeon]